MRAAARELLRTISAMITLMVPSLSAWAQCSVCRAALENAEGGGQMISGFNQGIGLMFAVMGVLGVIGWRIVRRARVEFGIRQLQHSTTVSSTNSCVPAENPASR